MKKIISCQDFLQIEEILEKGVLKLKNNKFIKIIEIIPINYNLKSELEKQSILNSYKIFLKTCNFDIQIIIISKKEDLNQINSKLNNQIENEENINIKNIIEKYKNYINEINYNGKSTTKEFFIIFKTNNKEKDLAISDLNEKYKKIKENLERCGNKVYELENKNRIEQIFFSYLKNSER